MSNYVVSDTSLTSVADAIRTKGGTSAALDFPSGFVDAIGAIQTGGGGASNVVTGTFKGTTSNAAMDVNLAYDGDGYPIIVVIFPSEGAYDPDGTFYKTIQQYALIEAVLIKQKLAAPTYNANNTYNYATFYSISKSSTTNNTSTSTNIKMNNNSYSSSDASYTINNILKIKSSKKLSIFIGSGNYGAAVNVEYTYYVIYSS